MAKIRRLGGAGVGGHRRSSQRPPPLVFRGSFRGGGGLRASPEASRQICVRPVFSTGNSPDLRSAKSVCKKNTTHAAGVCGRASDSLGKNLSTTPPVKRYFRRSVPNHCLREPERNHTKFTEVSAPRFQGTAEPRSGGSSVPECGGSQKPQNFCPSVLLIESAAETKLPGATDRECRSSAALRC